MNSFNDNQAPYGEKDELNSINISNEESVDEADEENVGVAFSRDLAILRSTFIDIYVNAYGRKMAKNKPIKNLSQRIDLAGREVERARNASETGRLHLKVRSLYSYTKRNLKGNHPLTEQAKKVVRKLAAKDFAYLRNEADLYEFVDYLSAENYITYRETSILHEYDRFSEKLLENLVRDGSQSDPKAEFPEARAMKRRFHLHIGPTNSGKTYSSIQQLKSASHGVYLSPLRLLALEIYDTMTEAGVACSMLTGEEHIYTPDATVISQTIETLDLSEHYDIAVIDEAQMVSDFDRGSSWSKAILGLQAEDIYLCASENAKELLLSIIESCGDSADITFHERKTTLRIEDNYIPIEDEDAASYIQEGDCFILFSKIAVLDMAARLEMLGFRVSVIYGKLPPETRKREVYKFANHETQVVVATDAIGMGINLPIRRIVFCSSQKFDGKTRRFLEADEIRQIAGRAGRFGLYEEGLVTATSEERLEHVREKLTSPVVQLDNAILHFPKTLLFINRSIDEILAAWADIPATHPYKKMNIKEMIHLYNSLFKNSRGLSQVPGAEDKNILYDMISCPIDNNNQTVLRHWIGYCKNYNADVSLRFPKKGDCYGDSELATLEDYYKVLDLYHIFSLRFGKIIDEEKLLREKGETEARIEQILTRNKKHFVRKCAYCGKPLTINSEFNICEYCHKSDATPYGRRFWRR